MNMNLFNVSIFGGTNVSHASLAEKLKRYWWGIRHRSDDIRFSIAAIVQIKIDDKYLLVMGNRIKKYQPVGGVLKFYPDAQTSLEACEMKSDNMFSPDEDNKDDLRIQIPGKHLVRFLTWYESGKQRELDPSREFFEELVSPGHLSAEEFPHPSFQHLGRRSTTIEKSDYTQGYECRIAEIFKLVPTPKQAVALRNLLEANNDTILHWATAETIKAHGVVLKKQTDANIAETAEWIVSPAT